MTDWQKAYTALYQAGYTDDQIAESARCSRVVINQVRNGTYPHNHEPGHSGGEQILKMIADAVDAGYIQEEPRL